MIQEQWKEIKGYEHRYLVSNFGEIYDKKRQCIQKTHFNFGYVRVSLVDKYINQKMFSVHRLVAEHFVGPPNNRQVHHIDEDRTNNRTDNLQWVTPKEHGELRSDESKRKFRETYKRNKKKRESIK